MSFGQNLKKVRANKKISQEDLSKLLGISRQAVASYEGDRREPKFEILIKMADYFNVSVDYLLGRTLNDNGQSSEICKTNIKLLMKNMTINEFVREVGNKTGILVSAEKLEALLNGNSAPDSITMKILAMYTGVSTDNFYKQR